MTDFRRIAKEELTLSPLMGGRTKLDSEELMKKYPDGVKVIGFDSVTMWDENSHAEKIVPVFATNNNEFFFGGTVAAKVASAWSAAYDGDVEAASADLEKSGGVAMRFFRRKTKKGNNLTAVEIL